MVKYEFGVMSKKWSLEAGSLDVAKIAMSVFIGKNIPVAIYSPETGGFMPGDVLTSDTQVVDGVKEALASVKDISPDSEEVNEVKKCFHCSTILPKGSVAKYIKGDINALYCSDECLKASHNDICIRDYEVD